MRIMISAAGSVVAPGIIRHLQSLGHYVIGHDSSPYGSAADEFHVSPRAGTAGYMEFIDRQFFDLYIPFLDEELLQIRSPLRHAPVAVSPAMTTSIFTDKIRQQFVLQQLGLPAAPRYLAEGMAIAKPAVGRGSRGIIKTDSYDIATRLTESGYLVQQFIEGDEYTVDVLVGIGSEFLFAVPRLRIAENGVSTIGKIVMDKEVLRLAAKIVASFPFAGPINIQIIREKDTGKLYIIEVNPRLSGSCMFTVMAGFDILNATIRMHMGLPFVPPEHVEEITVKRHYVEERL